MKPFPKPEVWHGLSWHQWLQLLGYKSWALKVEVTLRKIAACKHADAEDRLAALQLLNGAIDEEAFAPWAGYPEFMRDTMLDIIQNGSTSSWWRRRARARMHAQVIGARWMLQTVYGMLAGAKRDKARADAHLAAETSPTPAIDKLLS